MGLLPSNLSTFENALALMAACLALHATKAHAATVAEEVENFKQVLSSRDAASPVVTNTDGTHQNFLTSLENSPAPPAWLTNFGILMDRDVGRESGLVRYLGSSLTLPSGTEDDGRLIFQGAELRSNDAGDLIIGSAKAGSRIRPEENFTFGTADNFWRARTISVECGDVNRVTFATTCQGAVVTWNLFSGDASTYLINIGSGKDEGFKFFSVRPGAAVSEPIVRFSPWGEIVTKILTTEKGVRTGQASLSELSKMEARYTQEFCNNCISPSSATKHVGIPVWWDGSAWRDALGDIPQTQ